MREIVLPFISATITGLFGGLVVGVWVWAIGAGNPWRVGFMAGAVLAFLAWLIYRARVEQVENSLRGYREPPPPPAGKVESMMQLAPVVRVELRQNEGRAVDFIDLPATREQLHALAHGLAAGQPLTVTGWTGSGRPFSRAEFEALRAELIRRGLAEWRSGRSPAQGATLTRAGAAVMRYLAAPPPR